MADACGSPSVTVCGLMSGTSADGIDVAIVQITDPPHGGNVPAAFRLLRFAEVPWSAEDRKVCVEQTTGAAPAPALVSTTSKACPQEGARTRAERRVWPRIWPRALLLVVPCCCSTVGN